MNKFLTEAELNAVKGLVHYLNANMSNSEGTAEVSVEAKLIDSNGEHVGTITIHDGGEYGLVFP